MNRDTAFLIVYLVAVFVITLIHDPLVLGVALAGLMLAAGSQRWRIARRALIAIALFNSVVTVSYVLLTLFRGGFSGRYVVLMNARVFLLTFLTFFVVGRVNPFNALAFSRTLTYLFSLAYGHVVTFRRLYEDFRMALKSRTIRRARTRDLYRHGAAAGSFFLEKSLHDTTEITEAMKSRGFFND
jgi:cobalt/nickel transport system permease protein